MSKRNMINTLLLLGMALFLACGQVSEAIDGKLNELNEKAERLDSIVNKEVEKVMTLDSLIEVETSKVKRLDSMVNNSANKVDSITRQRLDGLKKIIN